MYTGVIPPSGRVNSTPSRLLDPNYAYLNDNGWEFSGVHRGNGSIQDDAARTVHLDCIFGPCWRMENDCEVGSADTVTVWYGLAWLPAAFGVVRHAFVEWVTTERIMLPWIFIPQSRSLAWITCKSRVSHFLATYIHGDKNLYALYAPHGATSTEPPTSNPTRTPVKDKRTYIPCPDNQEIPIHWQLKSVAKWGAWRGVLYIANNDSLFDISCFVQNGATPSALISTLSSDPDSAEPWRMSVPETWLAVDTDGHCARSIRGNGSWQNLITKAVDNYRKRK